MLNSDDAIHIVPLLWAGLGWGHKLLIFSHTAPSSCTAAHPFASPENKTKKVVCATRGTYSSLPAIAEARVHVFPSLPPPFPLPVGVKQPAASGRYMYSASNNPAPVPPNPFR